MSRSCLRRHRPDSTSRSHHPHPPAASILITLGLLFPSAALATINDGNHGNHIAVNEEESNFLRLEFLRCLQRYTTRQLRPKLQQPRCFTAESLSSVKANSRVTSNNPQERLQVNQNSCPFRKYFHLPDWPFSPRSCVFKITLLRQLAVVVSRLLNKASCCFKGHKGGG